jgi:colicin import membrane protein
MSTAVEISQSRPTFNPVIMLNNNVERMFANVALDLVLQVVEECSVLYNFDSEEAIALLNLNSMTIADKPAEKRERKEYKKIQREKTVKITKQPKTFPSIPMPYNGECDEETCLGLRQNHGLYTQCQNNRVNSSYCNTCQRQAEKNSNSKPDCGTIHDRMAVDIMDFKDPSGKAPTPFTKVMKKLNLTKDQVLEEAGKFNIIINDCHFESVEVKKGRPGKPKATKDDASVNSSEKKKGRPKKQQQLLQDDTDDIFAALIASASSSDNEEESVNSQEEVVEEAAKNEAKEAEKLAKEAAKQQKEAEKLAKETAKQQKEAEKLAKEAAKQQEKEAKEAAKQQEKEAKEAEKLAKEAAKQQEKEAKEAEKLAKQHAEKLAKEAAKKKTSKPSTQESTQESAPAVAPEPASAPAIKCVIINAKGQTKKTGLKEDDKKYLKTQDGNILNYATQEIIGKWNAEESRIEFNDDYVESESENDDDSDEEEEEEEYDE